MRLLRGLAGSLLWILSGVLGLVGVLLCVTVVLLPLGIPLLGLARRLFRYSLVFFLPRAVRHPVDELGKSARGGAKDASEKAGATVRRSKKAGRKTRKKLGKKMGGKTGKAAKRGRKKVARKVRGLT